MRENVRQVFPGDLNDDILQQTARLMGRNKQLTALRTIARLGRQYAESPGARDEILRQLMRPVGFEVGVIFVVDGATRKLSIEAQRGLSLPMVELLEKDSSWCGLLTSVAGTGEPVFGEANLDGPSSFDASLQCHGFGSYAIVPLRGSHAPVGVIFLASDQPQQLDLDSSQFLMAVAEILGLAVENAALRQEMERRHTERRVQAEQLQESQISATGEWPAQTEPLRAQFLQTQKMAILGQLISGVLHELNNPLTILIGHSELMSLEPNLPDSLRQVLTTVCEAAKCAARVSKNLLMFGRPHQETWGLVNLNDLVERTLALCAYDFNANKIELVKRFDPQLPMTYAEANQLEQVLLNLLINAKHAMLEAHGRGRLFVQTRRAPVPVSSDGGGGEIIELILIDDGAGIPDEHLKRIFEPFYTTKPASQGTGLGLYISRRIVQDHGGRLQVQSHPGSGTQFKIDLPVVTCGSLVSSRSSPAPASSPPRGDQRAATGPA